MEDIEDPTNLTGISSLVNTKHVNSKLDLLSVEKSVIGASGVRVIPEYDPAQEFKKTIRELSNDTGINFDDETFEEEEENNHKKRSRSPESTGSEYSDPDSEPEYSDPVDSGDLDLFL